MVLEKTRKIAGKVSSAGQSAASSAPAQAVSHGDAFGIVMATGAIAFANEAIFAPLSGDPKSTLGVPAAAWKLIPATLGLGAALSLLERIAPGFAVGLAWLTMLGMFVWHPGQAKSPLDNISKILGY